MNIRTDRILRGYCGAWFSGITGTKVDSLDCDLIDGLAKLHPNWQIVVEADGAKEKWLKAPKTTEPVIPSLTKTTIGLVNLQNVRSAALMMSTCIISSSFKIL